MSAARLQRSISTRCVSSQLTRELALWRSTLRLPIFVHRSLIEDAECVVFKNVNKRLPHENLRIKNEKLIF